MQGRHLAIALLAVLIAAVALIFYLGATGGGRRESSGTRTDQVSPVSFARHPDAGRGAQSPDQDSGK